MKRIIFGVFSFFSVFMAAQNQRFIYEYKFVTDSTDRNKTDQEIMYLDIAKKGSKFYSKKIFAADSIREDRIAKGMRDFSGIDYGKISFAVEKSYPDYNVLFFNPLEVDYYKVTDQRKMDWKILPEKEKIGEFNAQKAKTEFAGRQWTAWFVPDLPIQDGPYKFHGLPGMIIKIEDKTQSHSFVLKGIAKIPNNREWKSDSEKKILGSLVEVDPDQYKKQFVDHRNNPNKGMRQMMSGNAKVNIIDESGKPLDPEKLFREREKKAKEENAKNNNVLELYLLK
ncbi:GLPGLI family protein [Chryseobacterium camelliae]|uniref:GLPGLI family protein n=1 Tax=Chryseobacterium camelliae TaxID=1265445 RepID=A0ABY7QQ27_9FLAO|nr:GLPGLI family protein [Chryseobacterium camelliae]WBV61077.1 GLPGLI family protein [Chryseobacterium camelliae]